MSISTAMQLRTRSAGRLDAVADECVPDQRMRSLPEISRFFGIVVRMYYDDHNPPHIHVEYQGNKALFDFEGNLLRGGLRSRTALRLVCEWINLRESELREDWERARAGRELRKIAPLD